MIRALPHVAAMAPYALADPGPADVISLAQNESAFPPSPQALAAGAQALARAALYPDPDWSALRAALSQVHGLDPALLLCGAGSMELIGALIRAYAGPGDTVLGSAHGYAFAATATAQSAARYQSVPEPALYVDVRALAGAVDAETRLVFLCNPGNPTGTRIANADILWLRAALPDHVLLAVDQAYGEFADMVEDPAPILALAERGDTVILRSLSKAYGLAGARVGWAVVPPAIGAEMRKLLTPNNVSRVAQAMATAAIHDQDHMRATVRATATLRDAIAVALRGLGLTVPDSHTNFLLLRFADVAQCRQADRALRNGGLLLRGMAGYGLPAALRLTIAEADVMARVRRALEESLT